MKKDIILLGATGSIGKSTIEVIKKYPDNFNLLGISFGENVFLALKIINEFDLEIVCFKDESKYELIKDQINKNIIVVFGEDGLNQIVKYKKAIIVNALMGFVGLKPTIEAIKNKNDICLANKETLVVAGKIIMEEVKKNNVLLLPIDSEHSAIFQLLEKEKKSDIEKIIITASGGALRDFDDLSNVTVSDCLKHPNWNMGKKITIDSATMINKFFEILEAHYLFSFPIDKIEAKIHLESLIHGIIKYIDGNYKMLYAPHDMKIPILYSLSYPKRFFYKNNDINLTNLTFKDIKKDKYPLFCFCLENFKEGNMGAIINASNEAAVKLFLDEKIKFNDIYKLVKYACEFFEYKENISIDDIYLTNKKVYDFILNNYGGII